MICSVVRDYSSPTDTVVGLLFSADYCKWCKVFVPLLEEKYSHLKSRNIEIVLVASDKSEEAFDDYSKCQSWPRLSYDDSRRKELRDLLDIKTIPALVFVDRNGFILKREGRKLVEESIEQIDALVQHLIPIPYEYDSENEDF